MMNTKKRNWANFISMLTKIKLTTIKNFLTNKKSCFFYKAMAINRKIP